MQLLVDTRNGIAGDIFSAGLIGLGADSDSIIAAMELGGNMMGGARVTHNCIGGIHRINVDVPKRPDHLHAGQARDFLNSAMKDAGLERSWQMLALGVLEVLIEAETKVHTNHPALKGHFHGHEAVLHEASDIIIDIMGMAAGMMELDIRNIGYLEHVNVGSGTVSFSHGTLDVPTPATKHILESHGIIWKRSEHGIEMATPTGASILAGCGAVLMTSEPVRCRKAMASGTRPLPPVAFMLWRDNQQ